MTVKLGQVVLIRNGNDHSRSDYPSRPIHVKVVKRWTDTPHLFHAVPVPEENLRQTTYYYFLDEIVEKKDFPKRKGKFIGERKYQ